MASLHRIATGGRRISRRAAVLAISYLGGGESIEVIGSALRDSDRPVRLLASNGIHALWGKSHGKQNEWLLQRVSRYLAAGEFERVIEIAGEAIEETPSFAELWNKRAIAFFELDCIYESIADCQQVLTLNPFHFPASTGLAHCYLELDEPNNAILHFKYALSVYPDLEYVRNQIRQLQRSLDS